MVEATATVETTPADDDGDSVDDMAIWVDAADPARSVVIGANHGDHTLEVYDLSGERLQLLDIGTANNVDIRTGFPLGGRRWRWCRWWAAVTSASSASTPGPAVSTT